MNRKIKELFEQYTTEELADAFVFPIKLNKKQKAEAAEQLNAARMKNRQERDEGVTTALIEMRTKLLQARSKKTQ